LRLAGQAQSVVDHLSLPQIRRLAAARADAVTFVGSAATGFSPAAQPVAVTTFTVGINDRWVVEALYRRILRHLPRGPKASQNT